MTSARSNLALGISSFDLRSSADPLAICGGVAGMAVAPIDGESVGITIPQRPVAKGFEAGCPFVANGNSPLAIVAPSRISRPTAPVDHAGPDSEKSRFGLAVRAAHRADHLPVKTPAGACFAGSQLINLQSDVGAAIAEAYPSPSWFGRDWMKSDQPTESQAGKV